MTPSFKELMVRRHRLERWSIALEILAIVFGMVVAIGVIGEIDPKTETVGARTHAHLFGILVAVGVVGELSSAVGALIAGWRLRAIQKNLDAESEKETESLRMRIAKIQEKSHWRKMDAEKRKTMVEELKLLSGSQFIYVCPPLEVPEAKSFHEQIINVLIDGGLASKENQQRFGGVIASHLSPKQKLIGVIAFVSAKVRESNFEFLRSLKGIFSRAGVELAIEGTESVYSFIIIAVGENPETYADSRTA